MQLQDVEAGRAAQHVADLAGLQRLERAREQLRQAARGCASRARRPAARRARPSSSRRAGEVRAARAPRRAPSAPARAPPRSARASDCSGTRTRMCASWYSTRVSGRAFSRRGTVDLGVGHLDLVVDLALAQAREQDLLAHVLAEGLERDAVALERARGSRPGSGCSSARCAARRGRAAARRRLMPVSLRELHLHLVDDQALEDLALEQRARSGSCVPWRRSWRSAPATASSSSVAVITSSLTTATMRSTGATPCAAAASGSSDGEERAAFSSQNVWSNGRRGARARRREPRRRPDCSPSSPARWRLSISAASSVPMRADAVELELEHECRRGHVGRGLDALRDRAEHPAAGVVLEARQAFEQALVQEGVIVAPHGVPARGRPATGPRCRSASALRG